MANKKEDLDSDTVLENKEKVEVKKPNMYKVIFHNDDFTTMEFVIFVLQVVFQKSEYESIDIMLEIHHNSSSSVGVYTKDIATTKVAEATKLAEEFEYPLMITMEKD